MDGKTWFTNTFMHECFSLGNGIIIIRSPTKTGEGERGGGREEEKERERWGERGGERKREVGGGGERKREVGGEGGERKREVWGGGERKREVGGERARKKERGVEGHETLFIFRPKKRRARRWGRTDDTNS